MKKLIKNRKGFTLVELVIAVGIVAIVTTMFASAMATAHGITDESAEKNSTRENVVGTMDQYTRNHGTTGNESDETITVTFPTGGNEDIECRKIMHDGTQYNMGVIIPK